MTAIFNSLDVDSSGAVSFEEIQDLTRRTGGARLTGEQFAQIAKRIGCEDPAAGFQLNHLLRVYTELDPTALEPDIKALGLSLPDDHKEGDSNGMICAFSKTRAVASSRVRSRVAQLFCRFLRHRLRPSSVLFGKA